MNKYVTGIFVIILLLFISFSLITKSMRENIQHKWLKTKGTVLNAELYRTKLASNIPGYSLHEYKYLPRIHYSYSVNGSQYDNISISDDDELYQFNSKQEGAKFIGKYKKGSEITVFYKPFIHSKSALIVSNPSPTIRGLLSILTLILAIQIAIALVRESKLPAKKAVAKSAELQ